jgi:hypothetical protein
MAKKGVKSVKESDHEPDYQGVHTQKEYRKLAKNWIQNNKKRILLPFNKKKPLPKGVIVYKVPKQPGSSKEEKEKIHRRRTFIFGRRREDEKHSAIKQRQMETQRRLFPFKRSQQPKPGRKFIPEPRRKFIVFGRRIERVPLQQKKRVLKRQVKPVIQPKPGLLSKERLLTRTNATIALVLTLLLAIVFYDLFKSITVIGTLFSIGAFSTFYKRKLEDLAAIGFDLVLATTVIASIAFGPVIGMLFGAATTLVSVIISRDIGPTTIIFFFASIAVGGTASLLKNDFSLLVLGMGMVIISGVVVQAFNFFVQKDIQQRAIAVVGMFTNLFVNYLFFAYLAKYLLAFVA